MKDIEKRKIEEECANAPVSSSANELEKRGKTMEDLWFREHESELIEAARARRKSSACKKACDKHEKKCGSHG